MALASAQVVDAVAALLAPMAATGGRVYTSRSWPLEESGLPAWRVTAQDEAVESMDLSGSVSRHTLAIDADCYARDNADIDDTLHDLAAAGLTLLFAGTPPHGLELVAINRTLQEQGEAAMGRITLRLLASYFVAPSAPQTII